MGAGISGPHQARAYGLPGASNYPLPNRTITIDGLSGDWQGITPIFTDPKGDTHRPVDDGSDLKALYAAKDAVNLYLMVEFHAPANRNNWLCLRIFDPYEVEKFQLGVDVNGIRYVVPWSTNPGIAASYRDVVEFAIPLQLVPYRYIFSAVYLFTSSNQFIDNWWGAPVGITAPAGLVLQYIVAIDTSPYVRVQLNVSNIYARDGKFNITEDVWRSEVYHLNDIYNFTARDSSSQLTVRFVGNVRIVDVGNREAIRIDYSARLGKNYIDAMGGDRGYAGYVCTSFAVFANEMIFLFPASDVATVRVKFVVPSNWKTAAPWRLEGDWYDPAFSEGYLMDSLRHTSIALGDFVCTSRMVGGTNVTVATYARWSPTYISKAEDNMFRIFQHITSLFKTSIGERYLYILHPMAPDGKRINVGEYSNSAGQAAGPGIDPGIMITHPFFHRWNGGWSPFGMTGSNREYWLGEGATVYYDSKIPTKIHVDFPDYRPPDMKWSWTEYCKIIGTQWDAPVTDWERLGPYDDWHTLFIRAWKASLVNFLLDKILEKVTLTRSFDDVMAQVYAKYGFKKSILTTDRILQIFNEVSDLDFSEIFAKYVYGMEQLPLKLIGDQSSGELVVDWRAIALPWGTSTIVLDASPKPGYVNKPVNISGVLYGSWRCIKDGMVVNKPVEIATGWGFKTVATTDYYGRFSAATNCPSTAGSYTLTATFYKDQDLTGSSTTITYQITAKIPTTVTISFVGNREFTGYLRRTDTGGYLAYKPVKLTVTYLYGGTWQTTTYDLQTRQDGYWSLEFLFYWNRATIVFEGDETYAPSQVTITR